MTQFNIETSVFPIELDGCYFYCGHGLTALLERVPDGDEITVSSYSPGIVGMLTRAYPAILQGKTGGTIPWGPNNEFRLEWEIK